MAVFYGDDPAQRATPLELEGTAFIPSTQWLTLLRPRTV